MKLVFCLHDRGEGKRSCAASGSDALRRYAKEELEGETIKVKKSGCLGLCKHGPVVQLLPMKRFYRCKVEADIDLLIEQALAVKAVTDVDAGAAEIDALQIRTGKAPKNSKQQKS